MYCLRCHHASPVGAVFCGRCGRSFGCRVCGSGHRSPAYAKWCVACGKPGKELSEATPFVPVSGISRIMGWGAMLACLLFVLRNPAPAASGAASATLWLVSHALGVSDCAVVRAVRLGAYLVVLAYLLSYLLPASAGAAVRRAIAAALARLPRLAWGTARFLWRAAVVMVEGPRTEPKKQK